MSIGAEFYRIEAAAEIALQDNDVPKMRDLASEWKRTLAAMDPQRVKNFGPFEPLLNAAIERDSIEMIKVLVENGCPVSMTNVNSRLVW